MNLFYYIAAEDCELIVAGMVNTWLDANETAFVCCNGYYSEEIVQESGDIIYSLVRNQLKNYIEKEKYYENDNDEIIKCILTHFILEGQLGPENESLISGIGGLKFNTAQELSDYLDSL